MLHLLHRTGSVVQSGPFAGMTLVNRDSWGEGMDKASKLLGFYEQELHPVIETMISSNPDLVMNIGCAEGYYSVGLARRLPGSRVLACDSLEEARSLCKEMASVNQALHHVDIIGAVHVHELESRLEGYSKPFLLVDCEGAELELLMPDITPSLCRTMLLIECHDFANPRITPTLLERFHKTHAVTVIHEGSRNPNESPLLASLNSHYRWMAMNEGRPVRMNWILALPHHRTPE